MNLITLFHFLTFNSFTMYEVHTMDLPLEMNQYIPIGMLHDMLHDMYYII